MIEAKLLFAGIGLVALLVFVLWVLWRTRTTTPGGQEHNGSGGVVGDGDGD
ncbi:MAG: hypothetical protein AAFT19_11800 [Pseudomonadota bacterium]